MSVREIVHRIFEAGRKHAHRRRQWDWSDFGRFEGPLNTVWARANLPPAVFGVSETALADVLAGRLRFLSQDWPDTLEANWWTSDVWRLDPVSGSLWPGADAYAFDVNYRHDQTRGDVKFVWELNRLGFLPALAGTDEDGVDAAFDILAGWMAFNRPFQGVNWTSGIEAASRLAAVLALIALASRPFTEAEQRRLRCFIEAHAYWIDQFPSLYSSANNHRVAELAALYLAGLAMPGMVAAERYRLAGRTGLAREIRRQFHPDGVGAEQSPTYAAYSLEWFTLVGMAADAAGEPMNQAYKARAAAAAEHLCWIIDEAGHTPRVGDDDEGRVLGFGLKDAANYPRAVMQMTDRWLQMDQTSHISSPLGLRTFQEGGYTVDRRSTTRGMALLVFDHAPLGFLSIAAHGHADALSVWLHWGDEPILTDAGTFRYHDGGDLRDGFRGTPAHNTLTLEGEDQSRIVGPFAWSDHAEARLVEASSTRIVAEHSGYQAHFGLRHRRSVEFGASEYVIEDRLIGRARGPARDWRVGYLIHPDVSVRIAGSVAKLTTREGRRLTMTIENGPHWRVESAHCSPRFNQLAETTRLVIQGSRATNADPRVCRVAMTLEP